MYTYTEEIETAAEKESKGCVAAEKLQVTENDKA